jgi:hypothetical protein
VYYIFAQVTNSNVLGKLPIGDPNNREIVGGFGKNTLIQYTRDGEGPDL